MMLVLQTMTTKRIIFRIKAHLSIKTERGLASKISKEILTTKKMNKKMITRMMMKNTKIVVLSKKKKLIRKNQTIYKGHKRQPKNLKNKRAITMMKMKIMKMTFSSDLNIIIIKVVIYISSINISKFFIYL